MNTISLDKAKKIKLMSRVEKKYVCTEEDLIKIMQNMPDNYDIVSNNCITSLKYSSTYFDSDSLVMWNAHDTDEKHRQKIRVREYFTGEKFLEIKDKNKETGLTKKTRIPVESYKINDEINWISKNLIYDTADLQKTLTITYYRITLINQDKLERVTIDKKISFTNHKTGITKHIDDVVIEIKQIENHESSFEQELIKENIQQQKFSKYYKGILMTRGDV